MVQNKDHVHSSSASSTGVLHRKAMEEYSVWQGLVHSYETLGEMDRVVRLKRRIYLGGQIFLQYAKNFFKFPVWVVYLLLPSFFKGKENLWTNIKSIVVEKQFRPLRLAIVSQFVFLYAIVHLGFVVFYRYSAPVFAATYTWVQTSWDTLSTEETANHTDDRTGWNTYYAVSSTISSGASLSLTSYTSSSTQNSEAAFDAGTHTSTTVNAAGGDESPSSVTFSESFVNGVTPSDQCTAWTSFRSQLTDDLDYQSMTISGSNDPTGVTLTDPSVVAQLAAALRTGVSGTWSSGGRSWVAGTYAGSELSSGASNCQCTTAYTLRPCISNSNWGGINTLTCNGPSQTMSVTFEVAGAGGGEESPATVSLSGGGEESGTSVIGEGTTTAQQLPVNRYYNYSAAEMIYLNSELANLDAGASIESISFYKGGGSDSNPISSVTIYMKLTSDTTLPTGTTNLTGYTQVYTGSFPNDMATGPVNVLLDTPFAYDGSSHIQMLVVKGHQSWISTYPRYRYTSTVNTYRARYYQSDAAAWSSGVSLTQTYSRPNITFTFVGDSGGSYISNGTFLSSVIDTGGNSGLNTIDYTASTNASTTLTMDIRGGNTASPDGTWTSWETSVSNGADISALGNPRYVQYRANLSTIDTAYTPTLSSVTLNYDQFDTAGSLISSPFDAGGATNILAGMSWSESLPSGTDVTFQVRTSPNGSSWTGWMGPDGTSGTSFSDNSGGDSIPAALSDGTNDRWIQYKATLTSNGTATPILLDTTMTYVVNEPPEIIITASSTLSSDGTVTIPYDVRDIDTTDGATPGYVTVSLEYCTANCSGSPTWVTAATSTITGNIGSVAVDTETPTNYTSYTAVWTPSESYSGQYNASDFKIRLVADDNEAANNQDTAESNTFVLDTADPVVTMALDGRSDATSTLTIGVTDNTSSGLLMKLSNDSDLSSDGVNGSSGSWISYASSTSWNFGSGGTTVYYQVQDAYGNVSSGGSIASASTPGIPGNMFIRDVSQAVSDTWREFIAWEAVDEPAAGFDAYHIYRSTDGTTYTEIATQEDRTINFYLDSDVDDETTYIYRIATRDDAGSFSQYSATVSDQPDASGVTNDTTGPVISNVTVATSTPQTATITWDTNELSDSYVDYLTVPGGDFSSADTVGITTLRDTAANFGQHSVTLTNLTPSTTYYFRVRSIDPDNNVATSTEGEHGYTFSTLAGPTISNVSTGNVQNSQATITWNTDEASDSYVIYATDNSFTTGTQTGVSESVTSHSVTMTGLSPQTTYYYYVKSGISVDKNIVGGETLYYTFQTTADTAPPVITFDEELNVGVSDTTMTITFTTDEPATSTIAYGLTGSYGTNGSNDNLNTNHRYVLTGLTKGTTYYVRIDVADVHGNEASPITFTAETSDTTDYVAPVISNVTTTVVTDDQALIRWDTDESADSTVYYGTSENALNDTEIKNTYDRAHTVTLSDLATSTLYYYKVVSSDESGNEATSAVYTFTTLDTLIGETEVQQRLADAQAEAEAEAAEREAARADASQSSGGGGTLIIYATGVSDSTPPAISNPSVEAVSGVSAVLTWNTDEAADSVVEFGSDGVYHRAAVDWSLKTSHRLVLIDLTPLTTYQYRISSGDAASNRSAYSIGTFTTSLSADLTEQLSIDPEEQKATEELFLSSIQRASELIQAMSTRVSAGVLEESLIEQQQIIKELSQLLPSPLISGEPIVEVGATYATISWATDKASNSLVAYAPEERYLATPSSTYDQRVGQIHEEVTDHSVSLRNLRPDTVYHYQVISRTITGAENVSPDFTFKTKIQASEIVSYSIQDASETQATFVWSTNVPTTGVLTYTSYKNGVIQRDAQAVVSDALYRTDHRMTISDFVPGQVYEIVLSGFDYGNNLVKTTIPEFVNGATESAPLISQIKTEASLVPGNEEKIQVIISWNTNEPSTSRVRYRKGFAPDNTEFSDATTLDTSYTTKHTVVITNFSPGSVYQFQVESEDIDGDMARSKTITLLTPQEEKSVFQVIMGTVEELFSWVGKI